MSSPTIEEFQINSRINDHPVVGVDPVKLLIRPVISDGLEKAWFVRFVEGEKSAIISIGEAAAEPEDNKVVVQPDTGDPPPPAFEWDLFRHPSIPPVRIYSIINPASGYAWTLNSSEPKTQVVLEPFDQKNIKNSQIFEFFPVH